MNAPSNDEEASATSADAPDLCESEREIFCYCPTCGKNLTPPQTPHCVRPCPRAGCSRVTYVAAGPDGLQVEPGDRVVAPRGAISFSLAAGGSSRLGPAGIPWFMEHLYWRGLSADANDAIKTVAAYREEALEALHSSESLKYLHHLDRNSDAFLTGVIEHFTEKDSSTERWALQVVGEAILAEEAIANGDALVAAHRNQTLCAARAMMIFMRELNGHVWAGYQTNQLLAKAVVSGLVPGEQQALATLRIALSKLDDAELRVLRDDGRPIGARLSIPELPDSSIRTCIDHCLQERATTRRERADREHAEKAHQVKVWGIAAAFVAAILAALLTLLNTALERRGEAGAPTRENAGDGRASPAMSEEVRRLDPSTASRKRLNTAQ